MGQLYASLLLISTRQKLVHVIHTFSAYIYIHRKKEKGNADCNRVTHSKSYRHTYCCAIAGTSTLMAAST